MHKIKTGYTLLLSIILILSLAACHKENNLHSIQSTTDVSGHAIDFSSFKGQWVVINYWAGWCKPCLREIPELNRLAKDHSDIVVLGVSFDPLSPQKIQHFIGLHQISYPVIDNLSLKIVGVDYVKALPATFVFDPKGNLVQSIYGEITEQKIEQLIAAPGTMNQNQLK
ncbi:MAG: TlpA family protein disulfide reductase [Burkholderiaceae bacterium]|nr:TlpA family protein disulfide reductase [Burkholderiaceae bacterium]